MNWGSVAVDEERQLLVVNNMHLPFVIHMIPRKKICWLPGKALLLAMALVVRSAAHRLRHACRCSCRR